MAVPDDASDQAVLNYLRRNGSATIAELISAMGVTATAIRQRVTRLMDDGLIDRDVAGGGRGRPRHEYRLTPAGVRWAGDNYDQLAQVLWEEVRSIEQPEVRRGLLGRIAERLAHLYKQHVTGDTLEAKMSSLSGMMAGREVAFEVDRSGELPVLTALSCPFPDLAEQDRSVCSMERMLLAEVLGEPLQLSTCRLDGGNCCTFTPGGGGSSSGGIPVS